MASAAQERRAFLLPLWEKVPEGRMRDKTPFDPPTRLEPLTRLALRAIHPLPQGERGGSTEVCHGTA
jgi:hypothetical protein